MTPNPFAGFMTWRPTNGRPPRTGEKPLRVLFRNKETSKHTYSARQLRWDHNGTDFDITHWKED